MVETDEQLYHRFLTCGDSADLGVLLERHGEKLTLFLNGYVHSMEDAEELMLDAFATAAAGASRFGGHSSFRTWLFAIGRNLALSFLRKQKRAPDAPDEPAETGAEPPDARLLREERNLRLYQAMAALNPEYRQTLYLLYFEQMSHEEIASVTGRSRRQTYHLAERGRAALREMLERMGFTYEKL